MQGFDFNIQNLVDIGAITSHFYGVDECVLLVEDNL